MHSSCTFSWYNLVEIGVFSCEIMKGSWPHGQDWQFLSVQMSMSSRDTLGELCVYN